MSDAPVFAKRTKSKTIRAREEADGENETPDETKTVVSNFKNRTKRSKPQQKLSFNSVDEDDGAAEGETFQVKKSSLSKKMKFGLPTTSGRASPGSNLSVKLEQTSLTSRSEGPKYDASYLEDLKAYTNAGRQAPTTTNTDTEMILDASEMDGAIIENMEDLPLISSSTNADTMIPTEASIKATKDKRDRIRKTGPSGGGEEGFIPLTVSKRNEFEPGPHPTSRLMREDDDLGEGDDDDAEYTGAQERIALSKKGRKEAEKNRKKGIVEQLEDAEEEDEETMEWEMAQVRRAVPQEAGAAGQQQEPRTYKPQPIPTPAPIPTLDAAVLRISQTLTTFTTSHTQSTEAIATLTSDQMRFDSEEAELRRQVEQAEEKRSWFQGFRDRVETVAEFLDEKFPALEKLEEESVSILTERAEMIKSRRMGDNEDDLVLLYGLPPDMAANAEDQLDELGRTLPSATAPHSAVRRERRQDRSRRHQTSPQQQQEGYATDSELAPSDAADFEMAIQSLKDKLQSEVFADVKAKSFRDPKHGVAIWFKEWKDKWPDIYQNAFGGMGLVQTWDFWARCELVGWIPLDTPPRIDEFKWYIQLHDYTRPTGMDDQEEEEDLRPEDDLPVSMCSTMLIPRLNVLLSGGAFDPYSSTQIPRLIDLAEQLEASLDRDNIRFSSLLTTVAKVFRASVTELTEQYHRLSTNGNSRVAFDPESMPARQRYMNRSVKLIDNIMKWRRYAKERDGLGAMVSTILADVLHPVARGGWEVGGEVLIRQVTKPLPTELIPSIVKSALS